MKKVFFTAIAVIAFSNVSLANTIADENEVIKQNNIVKIEKQNVKIFKSDTICLLLKWKYYCQGIDAGLSPQQASSASYAVYFGCMGDLYP